MKKKIWLILLCVAALAAAVVFLVTRNGGPPREKLPLEDAAKKAFADFDTLTEYDGEELFDIVGVAPDDYTEFVYRTGENDIGLVARELVLVRAKDSAALSRVKTALEKYRERRQNETRSYAPDIFAMLEKSAVTVKGLTAALIISKAGSMITLAEYRQAMDEGR